MQQIIERFATYAGADPRRAPAVLSLAGYVEHAFGAWYPGRPGGLHAIPELLAERAQALGAELLLNQPVVQIEARGGRATAVLTATQRLPADAVVFGGDQRTLGGLLRGGAPFAAPVVKRRLGRLFGGAGAADGTGSGRGRAASVSGLALLLAVRPAEATSVHHEIRFCADYDAEFDDLFVRRQLVRDPTLYLSVPSVSANAVLAEQLNAEIAAAWSASRGGAFGRNPQVGRAQLAGGIAPPIPPDPVPALEPWFVLVNAPAGVDETGIDAYAASVEAKLGLRHGAVVARDRRTPSDLAAETGTPDGAIYGDAPHGRLGTLRRPGPLVPGLRGLVRVGGTVHPGGGVPLVMLSGLTAARLVDASA
jgi:phytoene dehydrogenase-like protein